MCMNIWGCIEKACTLDMYVDGCETACTCMYIFNTEYIHKCFQHTFCKALQTSHAKLEKGTRSLAHETCQNILLRDINTHEHTSIIQTLGFALILGEAVVVRASPSRQGVSEKR